MLGYRLSHHVRSAIATAMESGPTLRIKLASSSSNNQASNELIVDRETVTFWSSCAKGLPEDAEVWDLSQLLIEGRTVAAWLNAIYKMVHAEDFEQQSRSPASSATGLIQLLAFTDAVGSSRGLLHALAPEKFSMGPSFGIRVGNSSLVLQMRGYTYYWERPENSTFNGKRSLFKQHTCEILANKYQAQHIIQANNPSGAARINQQIVKATETLLYLSYKLKLPSFQKSVEGFIKENCQPKCVLHGSMDDVLSDRVLEAAAGDSEVHRGLLKRALCNPKVE